MLYKTRQIEYFSVVLIHLFPNDKYVQEIFDRILSDVDNTLHFDNACAISLK